MATAVTCPSCGTDAPGGAARWCGSCGSPLHDGHEPAPARSDAPLAIRLDEPTPEVAEQETVPARIRGIAILGVAALVFGFLALQADPSRGGDPLGFSARGDAARSGVVSLSELPEPTEVAWRVPFEGGGGWHHQEAALTEDAVAISSQDGVTLHDRATGAVRWHRPDLRVAAPVALFDDVVVVFDLPIPATGPVPQNQASRRGRIVAVATSDGSTRWVQRTQFGDPRLTAHPAGLVVTDRTRTVSLLEPSSGDPRWTIDAINHLQASVRDVLVGPDGDVVHLLLTRPAGISPTEAPPELVSEHLAGVDATNGVLRFEVAADRETFASQPLAILGDVIAGVDARRLMIWDSRTGERRGSILHGLANPIHGVVGRGDVAVVVDTAGTLTGFDAATVTRRWTQRVDGAGIHGLTVAGDNLIVPGSGRTSVLNRSTGQLRGTFVQPPGTSLSDPDDSGVFVVAGNGYVTLHAGDTSVVAEWPTPTDPLPSPVVRNGQVAIATAVEVGLFEADSGESIWRLRTSNDEFSIDPSTVHAVALAEDTVVFSPPYDVRRTPQEGLAGIDRVQSVFLWDRTNDAPPPTGPLTLVGDAVFVPVGDEVHGHDTLTGRRSFAARAGHPRGAVAAHQEYVVAASDPFVPLEISSSVIAIRRLDRSTAWEVPVDTCAAVTVTADRVLAVEADAVTALEIHRGGEEWAAPLEQPGCLDLAVADGVVVAVEGRTGLVGIDAESGTVRWRLPLDAGVAAAPTIAGDTVLVPLLDGRVAGVALADGVPRWSFDVGAVPGSSVVTADDRYVVLTREGELLAFGS